MSGSKCDQAPGVTATLADKYLLGIYILDLFRILSQTGGGYQPNTIRAKTNTGIPGYKHNQAPGVTGTLGNASSYKVLQSVYNLDMFRLPERYEKRYMRFPTTIIPTDAELAPHR